MIPRAKQKELDKANPKTALDSPKLKQAEAILKLKNALSDKLQKFFDYAFVEGKTLVIYFKHTAILMEFNRDKKDIKDKMRDIYRDNNMRDILYFTDVVAKTKHKPIEHKREEPKRPDRALGTFDIFDGDDKELVKKFENIRQMARDSHV